LRCRSGGEVDLFCLQISTEGRRPTPRSVRPRRSASVGAPPSSTRVCQFGQFSAVAVFVGARHASPSLRYDWQGQSLGYGGVAAALVGCVVVVGAIHESPAMERRTNNVLVMAASRRLGDRRSSYRRGEPLGDSPLISPEGRRPTPRSVRPRRSALASSPPSSARVCHGSANLPAMFHVEQVGGGIGRSATRGTAERAERNLGPGAHPIER